MTDGPGDPDRRPFDRQGDRSPAPPPPDVEFGVDAVGGDADPGGGHWMIPAAIGVVLGVVIAVIGVALTRSGDDTVASGTGAPPDGTTEVVSETVVATDPVTDTTAPPATTVVPSPHPTSTAAADTTPPSSAAPAATAPPPSTTDPATAPVTGPLPDGFVRMGASQYPIERTCITKPFAPKSEGFVVFSYLFRDEDGAPQIVDHWFDDEGVTGGSYSDNGVAVQTGYEFLGADEFALTVRRLDGETRVVVNPPADGTGECDGQVATNDSTTPLFTYSRAIVDICYGSQTGPLQYIGYLAQGGRFRVIPQGDGTATLSYGEPYAVGFLATNATLLDVDGGVDALANASSDSYTGIVTKDILVSIRATSIRDCRATDVPF